MAEEYLELAFFGVLELSYHDLFHWPVRLLDNLLISENIFATARGGAVA